MADQYIGPINMEAILESACIVTNWPSHRSWPVIVQHLRKMHIENTYIDEQKDYILETLERHSIHHTHGRDVGSSTRHGSPSCRSPLGHLQQWPRNAPNAEGVSSKYETADQGYGRADSISSQSSCNKSGQRKPCIGISHTDSNKHLPYPQPVSQTPPLLADEEDLLKIRSVKLWSFKRNTFLPAVSLEGVTSTDYIRRDIAEAADLEIEELGGGYTSLSGQDDFFPHEGCVVIAWQSEGWITTLTSEFVVTSNPQAPDLMIGHALRAKAECLRNMYRSYKALSHHYRYEAGLVHTPNHSLSSHALRSLHPKDESEGPDSPGTGYPLVTVSPRSRKPKQQHYGVQGRYHHNNGDGLDEDSPPTPQPLSVKSEPIKSSYSDNSPKVASMNRPTTTDRQTLFGQTTSTLRLSDALVASDPGHRNRNRNRDRTRVSLDQIKYWV